MSLCVECNKEIPAHKKQSIFCSIKCGSLNSYMKIRYGIKRKEIYRECLQCKKQFLYEKHKAILYCSEICRDKYSFNRDYFIKNNINRKRCLRGTGEKYGGVCINCGNKNNTYRKGDKKPKYCSKKCMDEYRYKEKCKICGEGRNINSNNALCIKCGASYRKIYKWGIRKDHNLLSKDRDDLTRVIRILSDKRKELYESSGYSKRN